MSETSQFDYLGRLAARTLALEPQLKPRAPSRFEPQVETARERPDLVLDARTAPAAAAAAAPIPKVSSASRAPRAGTAPASGVMAAALDPGTLPADIQDERGSGGGERALTARASPDAPNPTRQEQLPSRRPAEAEVPEDSPGLLPRRDPPHASRFAAPPSGSVDRRAGGTVEDAPPRRSWDMPPEQISLAPEIRVHIGRIEVRVPDSPGPASAPRPRTKPSLSLGEYLKGRRGE